jgi:starch synthase
MSKVLFISSEAYPLIKTGGLADVAGSLPSALLKKGEDIRLFLPAYPEVIKNIDKGKISAVTSYYHLPVEIIETRLPGTKVKTLLVNCPAMFDRAGGPYSDANGNEWHDNAQRFATFCHAAVDVALDKLGLDWKPDVVHCNDWQSGLVPALLSLHDERPATIFTIHNMAYQGVFDHQTYADLSLPPLLWHMDGLEFYGNFSFIKGGLAYADKITAVSPNYAREIMEPDNGYGFDGLLRHRSKDVSGILNGIDVKYWNPGTDKYLAHKYNRRSLDSKKLNKTALQKQLSLPVDDNIAMIGMVSRLVSQKGLDIVLQSLELLLALPVQVVILGSGDKHFEHRLKTWEKKYPDKMQVTIGYNEALAHQIEAGSDLYLMPSTFEPCGLNQIYSLRYGTLPIVTPVGGLADTVIDASKKNLGNKTANGFIIKEQSHSALLDAVKRALAMYNDKDTWRKMQVTAMSKDFSWRTSAENYIQLYKKALNKSRQ